MCANVQNEVNFLKNESKMLAALERMGAGRFKDLEKMTELSPRTLSKHLGSTSARGLIERWDKGYRITNLGIEHLRRLEIQLRSLSKRRLASMHRSLPGHYAVEVTHVKSSERCVGLLSVSLARELNLRERSDMDRALTDAIDLIANSIPADSRGYNATIMSSFKSAST
jgi:DNA-binding MarR family transcriptional regulator